VKTFQRGELNGILTTIIGMRESVNLFARNSKFPANPADRIFMSEVLLVEDSPVQREMISGILKDNGWKVTIACDGVEALEQLKTFNPDLVVLDIVMPKMNGYEVCRWIKSNPGTKNVPVVMCSSKGEEFDRYWGMRQGADAYIAKPFQPVELVGTIKQLLRS
jgi:twitching motility two-component system response regulator PilH